MRRLFTLAAVCLMAPAVCGPVRADGLMFVDEATWRRHQERSMINEPAQKAVVFFSRGTEDLIISPGYEGAASRFAWVVPVPARPKVEILKGALFHELAALVEPVPTAEGDMMDGHAMKAPAVTVLERKTVGAYDVSVLAATDGSALMKWLKSNKYHLPEKAVGPIRGYVKQGWTFVACRVKVPESAKGLRTGTLAPLRLTFPTQRPIYPIKLSSANPKSFSALVYLILPASEKGGKLGRVTRISNPGFRSKSLVHPAAVLPRGQRTYPTAAKLSREELSVFVERAHLSPTACTEDYVWAVQVQRAAVGRLALRVCR